MKRMSKTHSCSKVDLGSESSPDTSNDIRKQSAVFQEKCLGKRLLSPEEENITRVQKQNSK